MWPQSDVRLTSGPHGMKPAVVKRIQRDRLLKATTEVVARKGYAETTVRDLLAQSGLSRRTYYDLYVDKEDCYLDAFGEVARELEGRVSAAFERGETSDRQVRLAVEALAAFCVEEPAAACTCLVESLAAGPRGRDARNGLIERVARLLEPALAERSMASSNPGLMAWATVGGIFELLYGPLARHDARRLRELAEQIGELPLVPVGGAR